MGKRITPGLGESAERVLRASGDPFAGDDALSHLLPANYRQHMIESGMDLDAKAFNMFFTKSDAFVTSAKGPVTPPKHVSLLDYEIELALTSGGRSSRKVTVTRERPGDSRPRRRHCERLTPATRAAAANAILQGQELSRLARSAPG